MEMLFEFELEYDEKGSIGKNLEEDWLFLSNEIKKYDDKIDLDIVEKAYRSCCLWHSGFSRKSGFPYYTHPVNVALILIREFPIHDTQIIVAALLHDTIEDVGITYDDISKDFGEEVAELVTAVTKISHSHTYYSGGDNTSLPKDEIQYIKLKNKAETYRKLFLALVKDIRVILIKLADRLHNMRTLHYMTQNKQAEIAWETLNFYTPLAHRLGLNRAKMELENRSFFFSDRSAYEAIRTALNEKRRDFIDYIRVFSDLITNSLNSNNIPHTLSVVHKHEYEIYKMLQDGKSISDIDNFYSMVIIINSNNIHECYRAHGVLATAFNTVSFVDYISNPKVDWYKSLNTELYGPDGKRVEILIRTEEMEKISEEGFAAKFSFKEGRMRALEFEDEDIEDWGEWMQDVISEQGEKASQLIWDSIKVNLFDSEVFVYNKYGESVKLPEGATLVDYAFVVSKKTGLKLISGKVNGIIKNLDYVLHSGDQIELITSPNAKPHIEWKDFTVSYRAVYALHKYFNENKKLLPVQAEEGAAVQAILHIKGEDREGMLQDISSIIGMGNIRRINLDTSGPYFEGALAITLKNEDEYNDIFSKLLSIKGIKVVERLEDNR